MWVGLQIDGETMLIEIPEGYELGDFEWFGVYDHCKQSRTAYVSLKDVRPPAEAVLPEGIQVLVKFCHTNAFIGLLPEAIIEIP